MPVAELEQPNPNESANNARAVRGKVKVNLLERIAGLDDSKGPDSHANRCRLVKRCNLILQQVG
jgi:hypothetical protein